MLAILLYKVKIVNVFVEFITKTQCLGILLISKAFV